MQINQTLLTMIGAGVVTGATAFSSGVLAQEQESSAIEAEERIQVIDPVYRCEPQRMVRHRSILFPVKN